jgi:hypothetical protein
VRSIKNVKSSNDWIEYINGSYHAKYKLVRFEGKDVVIKDELTSLYLKLSTDRMSYNYDNRKIFWTLGYGRWKSEPKSNLYLIKKPAQPSFLYLKYDDLLFL